MKKRTSLMVSLQSRGGHMRRSMGSELAVLGGRNRSFLRVCTAEMRFGRFQSKVRDCALMLARFGLGVALSLVSLGPVAVPVAAEATTLSSGPAPAQSRVLSTRTQGPPRPDGSLSASSLAVYEWRVDAWDQSIDSYIPTLDQLHAKGVTTLLVDITRAVTLAEARSSDLRDFLAHFHSLINVAYTYGISVIAVAGDPHWVFPGSNAVVTAVHIFKQIENSQWQHLPAGLQFDVEPWGLADWGSNKLKYLHYYLTMVQQAAFQWTSLRIGGSLGFAIPAWFDGIGEGVPSVRVGSTTASPLYFVLESLGDLPSAELNVMTYRNHAKGPGGTLALFRPVAEITGQMHSPVIIQIGQETGRVLPLTTTFTDHTFGDFLHNVRELRALQAVLPRFGGVAVDSAESFLQLPG